MQIGISYVIKVTVTDYVNLTATAQQIVLITARPVPTVMIYGDQNPTLDVTQAYTIYGTGSAAGTLSL